MSTVTRERKPLKAVSVTGRWLQKPVWPCELIPLGVPGVLLIDGIPYLASPHAELPDEGRPYVTRGFRVTKGDGAVYDVDFGTSWGQWQCDCPDHVFRSERPGGCRHVAALRQALKGGNV